MDGPNGISLFDMKGIVAATGYTWDDFSHSGGIILATVEYNCNLDHAVEACVPVIAFDRLDDPKDPVSRGFNFRYMQTTRHLDGLVTRDLWKLYGIYVVFQVYGQGGRFDAVTFLINIGAMAAYFSVATVVCDFVLQYFLPNKGRLTTEKFRSVDEEEDASKNPIQRGHQQGNVGSDSYASLVDST